MPDQHARPDSPPNAAPHRGDSPGQGEYPGYPGYPDYAAYPQYPGTVASTTWSRRLRYVGKLWWIPIITMALACCARAVYVAMRPPSYVSTAQMTLAGMIRLPEGSVYSEELGFFFGTQIELMRSGKIRQRAAERLHVEKPDLPPAPVLLDARQAPKAAVFQLSATSPDPVYAQTFLDALMDEYQNFKKEMRVSASDNTLATVSERLFEQEKELKAAQDKLNDFQRDNNLAILQEQGTAAASYLTRLTTQLSDSQLELNLLDTLLAAGGSNVFPTTSLGQTTTAAAPADIQAARQQLEVLKLQREELGRYLRPKHPKMQKLDDEIDRGERLLGVFRERTREQLTTSRQGLDNRVTNLSASIDEWQAKLNGIKLQMAEVERLKANVARLQGLYERLLSLLQNVDMSKDLSALNLSVMERASPAMPAQIDTPAHLAAAGALGAAAGLALIFLIARFDDRFTTLNEIQTQFDEEIIGQVPNIPNIPNASKKGRLDLLKPEDGRHMFCESYRNIRSAILFHKFEGKPPKLLLVTSAAPGEGKSTVAANLACTLAFGGSKVLLMDCDIRKGALHEPLDLLREPGVTEMLHDGSSDPAGFISPTPVPNLYLLPTGRLNQGHSDVFLGPSLDALLHYARANYDCVIVDSAPVFAADDTTTLAPKMDAVLFVLRSGYTRARLARQALNALYQRQVNVLGLIVNRLNPHQRSYYYYKYAEYYADTGKRRSRRRRESERRPSAAPQAEPPPVPASR